MPRQRSRISKLEAKYRAFMGLGLVVCFAIMWWWITQREMTAVEDGARMEARLAGERVVGLRLADTTDPADDVLEEMKEWMRTCYTRSGTMTVPVITALNLDKIRLDTIMNRIDKVPDRLPEDPWIITDRDRKPIAAFRVFRVFRFAGDEAARSPEPRNDFETAVLDEIAPTKGDTSHEAIRTRLTSFETPDGSSVRALGVAWRLKYHQTNCRCHSSMLETKSARKFTTPSGDPVANDTVVGALVFYRPIETHSKRMEHQNADMEGILAPDRDEESRGPAADESAREEDSVRWKFLRSRDSFAKDKLMSDLLARVEANTDDDEAARDVEGKFGPHKMYSALLPMKFAGRCVACHNTGIANEPDRFNLAVWVPFEKKLWALEWYKIFVFIMLAFILVVTLAILYLVVRGLVIHPVTKITEKVRQIGVGNFKARVHMRTGDEFETLGIAFNRMVQQTEQTHEGLRELNQSLDEKVRELGLANLKLYEMNKLKGQFLANMSHELRTPLNSVIGFSEILIEQIPGDLNEKQARYVENIHTSGRNLLRLINDILDLAKAQSGMVELSLEQCSISSIIESVMACVPPADREHLKLESSISPQIPPVVSDEGKLTQIFTNLLSNALKFTPEGGRITVGAAIEGDRLVLRVADTGIGIRREDQNVIFEKFRQVDGSATRKFGGAGLGLSIVKELAGLLGGNVWVESDVGKGSTFVVSLPVFTDKERAVEVLRDRGTSGATVF